MSDKYNGLESQLFTWDGWDEAGSDAQDSIYYGIQLISPVGEFPAGHRFSFCNFMPSEGLVEFFDKKEDRDGHVFRLKLSVESTNA